MIKNKNRIISRFAVLLIILITGAQISAEDVSKLVFKGFSSGHKTPVFGKVEFKNGKFIAYGVVHGNLRPLTYTSKDGKKWQAVTAISAAKDKKYTSTGFKRAKTAIQNLNCKFCKKNVLFDLAYGKNKEVVAVGGRYSIFNKGLAKPIGYVLYSKDGKNFLPAMGFDSPKKIDYIAKNKKLKCVPTELAYGNGTYIMGCHKEGFGATTFVIYTSTDGKSWKKTKSIQDFFNHLFFCSNYICETVADPNPNIKFVNGNFWMFPVVGGRLRSSPDGKKWISHKTGTGAKFNDLTYAKGLYVAVGAFPKIFVAEKKSK